MHTHSVPAHLAGTGGRDLPARRRSAWIFAARIAGAIAEGFALHRRYHVHVARGIAPRAALDRALADIDGGRRGV